MSNVETRPLFFAFKLYTVDEALGDYSKARSLLGSVSGRLSKDEFAARLALNWMRDNNPSEAIEELENADKGNPVINFYTGMAYYQKGELDTAESYFAAVSGELKDMADYFSALVMWEGGRKEPALEIFRTLSKDPDYTRYCSVFLAKGTQ